MTKILRSAQDDTGFSRRTTLPPCREVSPSRIGGFDQGDLLRAQPAFDLFLASDRRSNVRRRLGVHEPPYHVAAGETRGGAQPVVQHAAVNVVCDPDVKRPRTVGENIDEVRPSHGTHCMMLWPAVSSFSPQCHPDALGVCHPEPSPACPRGTRPPAGGHPATKGRMVVILRPQPKDLHRPARGPHTG